MNKSTLSKIKGKIHHWTKPRQVFTGKNKTNGSIEERVPNPDFDGYEISKGLYKAFPFLVPHRGASGVTEIHFQDRQLGGAIACTPSEATLLHLAAKAVNPSQALEIGSYIGWSSAHIASGIKCKLTCVDPFIEIGPDLRESTSELAKQRFIDNMTRAGLVDRINLICGRSPDVLPSNAPPGGWDFAFIDGWHQDDQPLQDIVGVLPYMAINSLMVLHDIWVRDVRDSLLFLLGKGYSIYVCETANYLTFAWLGEIDPNLKEVLVSNETKQMETAESAANRSKFGIAHSTLEQFGRVAGGSVLNRSRLLAQS